MREPKRGRSSARKPSELERYRANERFPGVVARTYDESRPAWPATVHARDGAPNVVLVVLDDLGFGSLGCFGGPIATPHFDRIAADGVRMTNMHATALCSPSRSCLLTGRNHHSNHMGCLSNGTTGFPGYDGYIPFENGFLSEILLREGYATLCLGKWHLAPEETCSAAGPFDRWPQGRGFERYYGFLGGDTSQYYPELVQGNTQVEPPSGPEDGYHLTADLVARAQAMIADTKQNAPDKPFFLYLATGAMHSPHHVPKEWADRYVGAFDDGWDVYRERTLARQKELGVMPERTALSRPDPDVPEWSSLSGAERRVYARMMEVYAGYLTHTDHYVGELIAFLEKMGEYGNTIFVVVSDNGASAEGGPTGSVNECRFFNNVPDTVDEAAAVLDELGGPLHFNHYPWGWAHACNAPFRRWKRETYRGGTTVPCCVAWPAGIAARGELRDQYAHIIDLVPTILQLAKIDAPTSIRGVAQSRIEGAGFAHLLADGTAKTLHRTQYFEMMGHRAIDHDGWRAVCPWPGPSFAEAGRAFGAPLGADDLAELDARGWELYHLTDDPAETVNLAKQEPARLLQMVATWYAEAGKFGVFPLDGRGVARIAEKRPSIASTRARYVFYPGTQGIPAAAAPRLLNRAFAIEADVVIPEGGTHGVLLSMGGSDGGISFYVIDGLLCFVHNYVAKQLTYVRSTTTIAPGTRSLAVEFTPTGAPDIAHGRGAPGDVRLLADGHEIGAGSIALVSPLRLGQGAPMMVGADPGSTVTPEYRAPFEWMGELRRVVVTLDGEHVIDAASAGRIALRKD